MLASLITATASLTLAVTTPTEPPPPYIEELERIAEAAFTAKVEAEHGEVRDVACAVIAADAETGIAICYGTVPDPDNADEIAIAVDVATVGRTDGYDSDIATVLFVHPDTSPGTDDDRATPEAVRRAAEDYLLSYEFEAEADLGRPNNPRCDTPDEVAEGETFHCRVDLVLSADTVLTAEVTVRITDDNGSILVIDAELLP